MSKQLTVMLRTAGENLTAAVSSLWTNRMRSFLTTIGIVIGVTTVTGVVSLIQGLNAQVTTALGELGATTIYVQKTPAVMTGSTRSFRTRPDFSQSDAAALEDLHSVSVAVAVAEWWVRAGTADGQEIATSLIGSESSWPQVTHRNIREGRFFTEFEVSSRRNVCVLGADVADRIFGSLDPLERSVRVEGVHLTVVGVTERRGEVMGESQDAFIVVPMSIFHKWADPDSRLDIIAVGAEGFTQEEVYRDVEASMRMLRGLELNEDNDFELVTADQLLEAYSDLTGGIFAAMVVISGIALLVGSIGIANIMLVSVTERTREIGIRKALGARNSEILMQFLTESVILSLTGGVTGIAAGAGLAELVSTMTPLPAVLEPWSVVLAVAVSVAAGVTAGVFPAFRAARMDPVLALGY
jgi:putative ABC transport system permease protein